jgi:uncharacterized membrane protein
VSLRAAQKLQYAALAVIVFGYAILAHYSNSAARAGSLGAALALSPLLGLVLAITWRATNRLIALLLACALGALLYRYWPILQKNYSWVYLLDECAVYGLLGAGFGRSLLADHVPLCTRLADKLHGPLTPLELLYTRRVTAAWALFFALMSAITLLLFFVAPLRVWSIFVNFCSFPLMVLMFVGEYAVRRRVLPQGPRPGILAAVRLYFAGSS